MNAAAIGAVGQPGRVFSGLGQHLIISIAGTGPAEHLTLPCHFAAVLDPVTACFALHPPQRPAGHIAVAHCNLHFLEGEQLVQRHLLVGRELTLVLIDDFRAIGVGQAAGLVARALKETK